MPQPFEGLRGGDKGREEDLWEWRGGREKGWRAFWVSLNRCLWNIHCVLGTDRVVQVGKLRPDKRRGLPRGRPGTRNQVSVLNSPLDEGVPKPAQAIEAESRSWTGPPSATWVLVSDAERQEGSTCRLVSSYYVLMLPKALKGRYHCPQALDEETGVPSDEGTCSRLFGEYLLCARLL